MPALKILTGADHPTLRKKSAKIPKVTKEILKLAQDMAETMLKADGVGLAAPQVGQSIRLCLAPVGGKMKALMNPEILSRSKEMAIDEEGCLSLPNIWIPVERPVEITVAYTDMKGKKQERKLENFEARVVQHEVDHLNGVLIVDYKKT